MGVVVIPVLNVQQIMNINILGVQKSKGSDSGVLIRACCTELLLYNVSVDKAG